MSKDTISCSVKNLNANSNYLQILYPVENNVTYKFIIAGGFDFPTPRKSKFSRRWTFSVCLFITNSCPRIYKEILHTYVSV